MSTSSPIIEFSKVNKWFGDFHVLRDIDLSVAKGERIVVCGPSGSGKSTLIRCVNRLEEHQSGVLKVDGTELTDDVKSIESVRRQVGMVFQQFNLFPHLTVLENPGKDPFLRHHAVAYLIVNGAACSVAFFSDLRDFHLCLTDKKLIERRQFVQYDSFGCDVLGKFAIFHFATCLMFKFAEAFGTKQTNLSVP